MATEVGGPNATRAVEMDPVKVTRERERERERERDKK